MTGELAGLPGLAGWLAGWAGKAGRAGWVVGWAGWLGWLAGLVSWLAEREMPGEEVVGRIAKYYLQMGDIDIP